MEHGEPAFLPNDLKLKHAHLNGDGLHQEVSRANVVHQHVHILVEEVVFSYGNWEARNAQILNVFEIFLVLLELGPAYQLALVLDLVTVIWEQPWFKGLMLCILHRRQLGWILKKSVRNVLGNLVAHHFWITPPLLGCLGS